MMDRRRALALMVVLVVVSSALGFYAGSAGMAPRLSALIATKSTAENQVASTPGGVDLKKIQLIQQYINDKFFFPTSGDKLTEGALKGMVQATEDKYSEYFNPKEYQDFQNGLKATFGGIGVHVELSAKTNLVTVVSPIKGSPGEQAGIKAGDAIIAVDDKDVRGMALDAAVSLIRGPKGTTVKLTIKREGVDDPLDFTLTRADIENETTESKMAAPGIGYIHIIQFNEDVSKRVAGDMATLKAQGMNRLILDLRMDPGGLLDEAVNTASLFLPAKQPVVFIESKGQPRETLVSKGTEKFSLPLLVLVDENSASAAEILAGALKDTKTGVLMGKKTFGKGIVQTFYTLADGSGIKLTTARYLTAGGNAIHGVGIQPDVEVDQPTKVYPGDPNDVQLQKAIDYIKTMKQ